MVGVAEVESATFCVSCKRSNQLSYTPEKEVRGASAFSNFLASPFSFFSEKFSRERGLRERVQRAFVSRKNASSRPCTVRNGAR